MPEQFKFTPAQEKKNDELLDEINIHLKKIEELKSQIALNLIDKSDSEDRNEQIFNQQITHLDPSNPVLLEINKEQEEINRIKSKMLGQNH